MAAHLVLLATLFSGLVKDKTILAAEVMHEYDEKVSRDIVRAHAGLGVLTLCDSLKMPVCPTPRDAFSSRCLCPDFAGRDHQSKRLGSCTDACWTGYQVQPTSKGHTWVAKQGQSKRQRG